jgi:hypothetical protein
MNGLRAGMSAPPLMAAARVAAGVTSLTRQEPTFTGPLPNRRSRPKAAVEWVHKLRISHGTQGADIGPVLAGNAGGASNQSTA